MSPFDPSGGTQPHTQLLAELMHLLQEGKPIQAIKTYRDATKQGLKEAKDFVDRLQEELKKGNVTASGITIDPTTPQPTQITTVKKGFGCFTILFIFLLGVVGGLLLGLKFPSTLYLLRQILVF